LVVTLGTCSGALLPILFRKFGMDPALMSNPLIAALVDILGVVIYYSVAIFFLGRIAPQ
jgi:magnesium transporter